MVNLITLFWMNCKESQTKNRQNVLHGIMPLLVMSIKLWRTVISLMDSTQIFGNLKPSPQYLRSIPRNRSNS